MADKKDPGKFTIRFNIEDPQQLMVVGWLNRQGRYKAQFITKAVLYYTHAALAAPVASDPVPQDAAAGTRDFCHESEDERECIGPDKTTNVQEAGKDCRGFGPHEIRGMARLPCPVLHFSVATAIKLSIISSRWRYCSGDRQDIFCVRIEWSVSDIFPSRR